MGPANSGWPILFLLEQLLIGILIAVVPEDAYKLLPAKGTITDKMLHDAYAGESGAWVTGNYHETVLDGDIKDGYTLKLKAER